MTDYSKMPPSTNSFPICAIHQIPMASVSYGTTIVWVCSKCQDEKDAQKSSTLCDELYAVAKDIFSAHPDTHVSDFWGALESILEKWNESTPTTGA